MRQTGASKSTAFMFAPVGQTSSQGFRQTWEIPSLNRYIEGLAEPPHPFITSKPSLRGRADNVSPNTTLNVRGAIPDKSVVVIFAIIGVLFQIAILGIISVVTYKWKLLRSGKVVAGWGYPIWAAGTVAISLGMSMCGWAIGDSTRRKHFQPHVDLRKPASIVLPQEAITEQNILAYSIGLVEPNVDYVLSKRSPP